MKDIFEFVRVNLARAFTTQSHYYNLRRRDWRCHIGDLVMRREHYLSSAVKNFAAKLAPKYSGPYRVVRVVSPVVYDLRTDAGKLIRHVHIKDLKPAHKPADFPQDDNAGEATAETAENQPGLNRAEAKRRDRRNAGPAEGAQ